MVTQRLFKSAHEGLHLFVRSREQFLMAGERRVESNAAQRSGKLDDSRQNFEATFADRCYNRTP